MADLSAEHLAVQGLAREFADGEIAPHSNRWNREKHIPVDVIRAMGGLGFFEMLAPEDQGGSGLGLEGLCVAMEEIAAADAGIAAGLATQASLGVSPLLNFATPAQKDEWMTGVMSGDVLASYALTEPGIGSDTANLQTRAEETGDGFAITGTKMWITNGGFSDVVIVFARSDGEGARGVSAFVVKKDEGIGVSQELSKMGLHTSSTVELSFDSLEIGGDRLLGARGEGLKIALSTLDTGRAVVASQAVGIARAALEVAISYAGRAQRLRRSDRPLSRGSVPYRGDRGEDRRRPPFDPPSRPHARRRAPVHRDRCKSQTFCQFRGGGGRERGRSDTRWLWLFVGISGRTPVSGCKDHTAV